MPKIIIECRQRGHETGHLRVDHRSRPEKEREQAEAEEDAAEHGDGEIAVVHLELALQLRQIVLGPPQLQPKRRQIGINRRIDGVGMRFEVHLRLRILLMEKPDAERTDVVGDVALAIRDVAGELGVVHGFGAVQTLELNEQIHKTEADGPEDKDRQPQDTDLWIVAKNDS